MTTNMGIIASGRNAPSQVFPLDGTIAWDHAYWTEGAAFTALGYADAAAVGTFPDEFGGFDMTATGTERPTYAATYAGLNSKPAINFDGNDILDTSPGAVSPFTVIPQPFTVVAVVEGINAGTIPVGIGTSGPNNDWCFYSDGQWKANLGTTMGGGTADTAKHLMVFVGNGASSKIIVDGTTVVTADAGARDPIRLQFGGIPPAFKTSGAGSFLAIIAGELGAGPLGDLRTWSQSHYGTP